MEAPRPPLPISHPQIWLMFVYGQNLPTVARWLMLGMWTLRQRLLGGVL